MKILTVQLPAESMKRGNTLRLDNDASLDGRKQKATREIPPFQTHGHSVASPADAVYEFDNRNCTSPIQLDGQPDIPLNPRGYFMYHLL
jgi:hypothetical protein